MEKMVGDREAKTELFDQFARIGGALASGKRLELLDLLAQGERSVDALAQQCEVGMTTVSAHLQTLKQAKLVVTRREGTKVFYRLAGLDVAALLALVRSVGSAHLPDVEAARRAYFGTDADADCVSRDELLRRAQSGSVTILDVRPVDEYVAGHIPGALGIPLNELERRLAELPTGNVIVAYCRGAYCVFANDAVRLLTAHGHDAVRLADGMLEWRLAELPVAS